VWEAEITQYHDLLPSSAGSSEVQDRDQTRVFKKYCHPGKGECLPCDRSEICLEEEVETYVAVPRNKEMDEVKSLST